MRTDDFIITLAYFSIPFQILASLYQYPRLAMMPMRLQILVVLFAFFIFLCGAGHGLRCMEQTQGTAFQVTNFLTAVVSLATCLYLIPLVPSLMSSLDENLQSLKYLNEELEASKRKLMTFMAFLCHEIRNPLFVITSNISFLEDNANGTTAGTSSKVQEQALQAISQSADVMLRLVNDVLDISKLESGKLELQEHDFDLRETLRGVASSTARLIQQRHGTAVAFTADISPTVPHGVFADSVRFLQIVYNLLSNANKFTERGQVRFSVTVVDSMDALSKGLVTIPGVSPPPPPSSLSSDRPTTMASSESTTRRFKFGRNGMGRTVPSQSSDEAGIPSTEDSNLLDGVDCGGHRPERLDDHVILRILVQDSGMGIPADQIERLFQPYAQSKLANYRKHGGTGLGLAIVSKLTYAMGGNVRVQSDLGRGSTFEVYLPIQVSNSPSTTAMDAPSPSSTSRAATTGFSTFRKNDSYVNLNAASGVELSAVHTPIPKTTIPLSVTSPPPPPATAATPSSLPSPSAVSSTPTSTKKKIVPFDFAKGKGVVLVVDDNDMNRKLLKRMLSQFKLEHVEAANGQEAVDAMLTSRNFTQRADAPEIALVLMDLSMPVMDGYEATSTIRQYQNFQSLPIIALTAATIEEGKQRAMESGVTEYQTKPIKRDLLYTLCQRYLHNVASSPPAPAQDLLT